MKTKEQKREEAKKRQDYYDSLTLEQKIQRVRNSPGDSLKEFLKLQNKDEYKKKKRRRKRRRERKRKKQRKGKNVKKK